MTIYESHTHTHTQMTNTLYSVRLNTRHSHSHTRVLKIHADTVHTQWRSHRGVGTTVAEAARRAVVVTYNARAVPVEDGKNKGGGVWKPIGFRWSRGASPASGR